MIDVKWIKITTDMFDNRKIKHLRKLPDGNSIVLIWVMLLTMAGRCNAGGMIFLTENIPYTPKMLADELGFEETTIQLALKALAEFGMIIYDNEHFLIAGWNEYQNTDGMDKIRQQTRDRVAKYRQKYNMLPKNEGAEDAENTMTAACNVTVTECNATCNATVTECNVTCNATVTECNATEEERDIEKEIDKEKRIDYQLIADMYNDTCVSFPRAVVLSNARKKAIKARLRTYTIKDFEQLFKKAEASNFLKGGNDRNWSATFDWLIKDSNMAKVLGGNYDNKSKYSDSAGVDDTMARQLEAMAERQRQENAQYQDSEIDESWKT